MKNKNKTIIEANKGSISKKIGRFAVIVVLYIALVSTLAFVMSTISLFVNADSVGGGNVWSNPYTYSSMYIYTDNGAYCVGSNDYFTNSTDNNISFDDYYSVLADNSNPTDLTSYFVDVPSNFSVVSGYGRFKISGNFVYQNTTYSLRYTDDLDYNVLFGFDSYGNTQSNLIVIYYYDSFNNRTKILNIGITLPIAFDITGGTDATNQNLIQWFVDNNASFELTQNTRAVADSSISIKRLNTATYNSNDNYYSVFSEITSPNIIGFDFNFTKDIAVTYAQLTNNEFYYNYSMTNDYSITKSYNLLYYDIDGNLSSQEITSVISYDAGDTGTLLPTLNEIEYYIGEDTIGLQDIFLIQDLYVSTNSSLVIGTDYVHIFEWLAYNPTRTKQITNDYVNNFYRTTKLDVGEILLNSVNSFLKFELIPGFSLLSLLALVIGIPLLIYILKLFLGG